MATYLELEELQKVHQGEVCIFGCGQLGRYDAYELIKTVGFQVNYYCDNHIMPGTIICDGIEVREVQYLYDNNKSTLVFLCVSLKYQDEILQQLKRHSVNNVVIVDIPFIFQVLESIAWADDSVKQKYYTIYDDIEFLKRKFKRRVGYELNIVNPTTFNEKLQWLKVNDRNPEYTRMVDKHEFKLYVEEVLGKGYTIPTLGLYDTVDEIEWDKLPEKFVLKCTHDSGSIVICKDKKQFDIDAAVKKLESGLKGNYYWASREWPYRNVKPRVIAEEYMEDARGEIIDYKFLCYRGTCKYVFTCTERFAEKGLKVTFFDREWNKLSIKRHYPISEQNIEKPTNYDQMLELAESFSEKIPFVRIDFYEINGRLYVGEFTFYPGGGMEEFDNYEDDVLLGKDIICD